MRTKKPHKPITTGPKRWNTWCIEGGRRILNFPLAHVCTCDNDQVYQQGNINAVHLVEPWVPILSIMVGNLASSIWTHEDDNDHPHRRNGS